MISRKEYYTALKSLSNNLEFKTFLQYLSEQREIPVDPEELKTKFYYLTGIRDFLFSIKNDINLCDKILERIEETEQESQDEIIDDELSYYSEYEEDDEDFNI